MSHIKIKTTYEEEGVYGTIVQKTLYAHHNNVVDVVSIYDESGELVFSYSDTIKNNMLEAIKMLTDPYNSQGNLRVGVTYVDEEDRKKIKRL